MIVVLCLVSSVNAAWSRCSTRLLFAYPPNTVKIPPDVHIVLNGCWDWQKPVENIGRYRPRLFNKSDTVDLKVVETCHGDYRQSQCVLVPVRELRRGLTYRLLVDASFEDKGFEFDGPIDWHRDRVEPTEWEVGAITTEPAKWLSAPVYEGGEWADLGCGPEVNQFLGVQTLPSGDDALIRVEFRDETEEKDSSEWRKFYVPIENGLVAVGHDMCQGPFLLQLGHRYVVRLCSVGLAGKVANAPGSPLKFGCPRTSGSIDWRSRRYLTK